MSAETGSSYMQCNKRMHARNIIMHHQAAAKAKFRELCGRRKADRRELFGCSSVISTVSGQRDREEDPSEETGRLFVFHESSFNWTLLSTTHLTK